MRLFLFLTALLAAGCSALPPVPGGNTAPVWGRWERTFTARQAAGEETELTVELTAPSGRTRTVDGFWDGGDVWRVRFMPDEAGTWTYRTRARPAIEGLDGQQGGFTARPDAATGNRFLRHGPVRVAEGGRFLAHADGTPFFWLGDTAWNGALLSTPADWNVYLADRGRKNFTAIQFVTTQWRAGYANAEGEKAYTGFEAIRINPDFFRRMDERVDAVNAHGLLAAPVLLWALGDSAYTPGKLPEDQAVRLARYLVARYGANHVVWILGGDEHYGARSERWKRIGRRVFDRPGAAPVTLHPQGQQWDFDRFADEPWLDFLIYQSGHGDGPETLRWIHSGPVADAWKETHRPIINSEPPYEDHLAYQSRQPHPAYHVRRAAYWSLLAAPTAGVSYGAHGVWSWEARPNVPLNHANSGTARPWHEAIQLPGSTQMGHAAALFTSFDWWRLLPAPDLLAAQPGGDDPARFVAAARTEAGDLAVLYLPAGGSVSVRPHLLRPGLRAAWFDPRTGRATPAGDASAPTFTAPDGQDWVLVLR